MLLYNGGGEEFLRQIFLKVLRKKNRQPYIAEEMSPASELKIFRKT